MQGKNMRWFKFLMYFGIWFLAVGCVVNGVTRVLSNYDIPISVPWLNELGIYNFTSFQTFRIWHPGVDLPSWIVLIDIIYGFITISCAVWLVIARSKLKNRQIIGVDWFKRVFVLRGASAFLYYVICYDATLSILSTWGLVAYIGLVLEAIISLILYVAHKKYFKNREEMFN